MLDDAVFVMGHQIADVIKDSFTSGVFPSSLKKSTIIPIQKKTGTVMINEHRPINMLPCIEKLIEKLAHKQISSYINRHELLYAYQSGYREKHSCETAINEVLYEWKMALNDSKFVIAVFLDFQRAFETIQPEIMFQKLKNYGFNGIEMNWFESYLSNRTQVVKIGNIISKELNNDLGVPQGSILGPLLFLLYINDLVNCLKFCKSKMFADDTLVYIVCDSLELATQKLNEDLSNLFVGLCQNKLKLNVNKTKVMILSNKNFKKTDVNIYINGTRLTIEDEIKYLGVYLDSKLKLDKNTNNLCKKLGQQINILGRLRRELNTGQKMQLYKSMIESQFTCCASVLFLITQTDMDRLQKLQNKCFRNILNVNKFTSPTEMRKLLECLSVKQIIIFRTLIFIQKIINGEVPTYLTEKIKFNRDNQSRVLRSSNDIELVRANMACSQNSLFYKGVQMYNSIPDDIKNENVHTTFKRKLKEYVKQKFE